MYFFFRVIWVWAGVLILFKCVLPVNFGFENLDGRVLLHLEGVGQHVMTVVAVPA